MGATTPRSRPAGDRLDLMTEAASRLLAQKPTVLVVVGATAARQQPASPGTFPSCSRSGMTPLQPPGQPGSTGGERTGCTTFDPMFKTKQLQLLKSALPDLCAGRTAGRCQGSRRACSTQSNRPRSRSALERQASAKRSPNPDFDAAFERSARSKAQTRFSCYRHP